jgi:hypothetical protein
VNDAFPLKEIIQGIPVNGKGLWADMDWRNFCLKFAKN